MCVLVCVFMFYPNLIISKLLFYFANRLLCFRSELEPSFSPPKLRLIDFLTGSNLSQFYPKRQVVEITFWIQLNFIGTGERFLLQFLNYRVYDNNLVQIFKKRAVFHGFRFYFSSNQKKIESFLDMNLLMFA